MYSVLLANDNLTNEVQLVRDYTASITSACDAIATDSASMQALLQVGIICRRFHFQFLKVSTCRMAMRLANLDNCCST